MRPTIFCYEGKHYTPIELSALVKKLSLSERERDISKEDYDKSIGQWIQHHPYLWVQGKTSNECKRFYILHPNAAAVFDEDLNILDPQFVKHALSHGTLNPRETFSILPIKSTSDTTNDSNQKKFPINKEIQMFSRNHFLMYIFGTDGFFNNPLTLTSKTTKSDGDGTIKFPWTDKLDVRIEGKRVNEADYLRHKLIAHNLINIVTPEAACNLIHASPVKFLINKEISVYPFIFGNPHHYSIPTHKAQLYLKCQGKKPRIFLNLYEVVRHYKIDNNADIRWIHVEALKNGLNLDKDYHYLSFKEDIIKELEYMKEPLEPEKNRQNGWYYMRYANIPNTRIIFETLCRYRPIYKMRNPEQDLLQTVT